MLIFTCDVLWVKSYILLKIMVLLFFVEAQLGLQCCSPGYQVTLKCAL